MRPFRSLLLRRLIALALVAGVSAPLVPTASAQNGTVIGSVLDDERAFEHALAAARVATGDPIVAFAQAYADATDGAVTAEAIERLLDAASMSGVLPVATDRAIASTTPAGPTSPAALDTTERALVRTAVLTTVAIADAATPATPTATSSRPRAP